MLHQYEITTRRLTIRPFRKEDYTDWFYQHKNRLPSQHKYDEGNLDMCACTEEWFDSWIKRHEQLAAEDSEYLFGVFRQEDNAHLGDIDISTLLRGDFQWGRVGYMLHNQHWNQGYGKEAVQAVMHIAMGPLQFHRIEAHINTDNLVSIKLAESVGMKFECIRKSFIYEHGNWTDQLIYFIHSS
ncbi:GNAT family N-acetyltransferase [Paenibacillus sp. UMB4589-SE434]|uniref:GNAT family N-acetyltransferase n=1 Tax=Paenibacillus sp. UMB4589-SE434 TaxID=3046314 RepID=UPI00254C19F8|nr:GNAT family N-acetyltransferase [Paenibacillus sp. UMB4589-SE434]MDK8182934.1 GNAT family N-acetyltransferase [Paenibacillus sp. UMB4589-SE434]